jgi:hypothetical protein
MNSQESNKNFGAGDRDRTDIISLEGWGSTFELHPQPQSSRQTNKPARTLVAREHESGLSPCHSWQPTPHFMVEGEGFEPSKA